MNLPPSKPKKYLWIFSTLMPLVGAVGMGLYQINQNPWMLLVPLVFIYLFIPLLDTIFSTDDSNPNADQVAELEQSAFYDWVLYLMLPLHFGVLIYSVYFMLNEPLGLTWQLVQLVTVGVFGGLAVNLGHELGHKKSCLDRNLAKLALASGAYGHFNIEHNAGHHREVATPEDSASARLGESIYQFVRREYPGGLKAGVAH